MPLHELNLVALIQDADLLRSQLIRRVEEAHQPIADPSSLVIADRRGAGSLEGHVGRLGLGPQRIRFANPLQGRPSPAGKERFVHCR
jgi:hypothetical protein